MLKLFEDWLHQQGYRFTTITSYMGAAARFLKWCEKEGIAGEQSGYAELLLYVRDCKSRGNAVHTVNGELNALEHFFAYCVAKGWKADNPASELRIRGRIRKVAHGLLSVEALEQLYTEYAGVGLTGKRDKAMVGLLVYQGLLPDELYRLEITDLKLGEGKVYVPAGSRTNSRVLELEGKQVMQLQQYVVVVRPALLSLREQDTVQLFLSSDGRNSNAHARRILHQIRKVNPTISSVQQIRSSVISHWIKAWGVRQAQYRSGHRYVSSTDHYSTDKLETLQEQLNSMHPLG